MQEEEGNSGLGMLETGDKGISTKWWPGLQCLSPMSGVRDLAGCGGHAYMCVSCQPGYQGLSRKEGIPTERDPGAGSQPQQVRKTSFTWDSEPQQHKERTSTRRCPSPSRGREASHRGQRGGDEGEGVTSRSTG